VVGFGIEVERDVGGDVGGGGPGVEGGEGEAGLRGEGSEVEVGLQEGLEEGGILGGEVGELGLPFEHVIVWGVFGFASMGWRGMTARLRTGVVMRAQVVGARWFVDERNPARGSRYSERMGSRSWLLVAAGIAGVVGAVLAGASLTIWIIARARPPVSEYLDAAGNARLAESVRGVWILPVGAAVLSGVQVVRVIRRRPLERKLDERSWEDSAPAWVVLAPVAVLLVLCACGVSSALHALAMESAKPLTDSHGFSILGSALGNASFAVTVLSAGLLWIWRRGECAAALLKGDDPGGAARDRARPGPARR
jgi:hypothetical protein